MGCSLRLQRFCCCCTLKRGTLVIGTLGWLGSMSQIFMAPARMQLALGDDEYEHSENNRMINHYHIARIGTLVVSVLINVLLIVGVYKQNNKFMLPWLVLQCLGLIIISIVCLICFGAIFFADSSLTAVFIALAIGLFLAGLVGWYFWLCVWSHYMELNDKERIVSPNAEYAPTDVSPPPYNKADAPLV